MPVYMIDYEAQAIRRKTSRRGNCHSCRLIGIPARDITNERSRQLPHVHLSSHTTGPQFFLQGVDQARYLFITQAEMKRQTQATIFSKVVADCLQILLIEAKQHEFARAREFEAKLRVMREDMYVSRHDMAHVQLAVC